LAQTRSAASSKRLVAPAVAHDRRQLARRQPGAAVEAGIVGQHGAPPVDVGHQLRQVADQQGTLRRLAIASLELLRRRETDRLGHHVVAVQQRVVQQLAQRRALVDRDQDRVGRRHAALRRADHDVQRERQPAEQIAGVQPRVLDRELARLSPAAAVGDPPDHRPVLAVAELDPAGRQPIGQGRLEARLLERRQGHGHDRTAGAAPGDVHAIERDRQRADARVVGRLRGLVGRDLGRARQRRVVDQEAAMDLPDPGGRQMHGELEQIGHVQRRIAAALENEVAL
jgi:hypothetical protein